MVSDGNNKKFNNLKIHTQYSICEGAVKIDGNKMTDKSFDKPGFSDMAQRLIVLSEKFDSNPTTQNYNEIIYMCQSCHNYLCPGPLELIKKLEYSVDDLDQ